MKFNALKLQLNQWAKHEKKLDDRPVPKVPCHAKHSEESKPPKVLARPIEKVVGGDILWKPIDKQAAMLLAKSPWWAMPLPESSPKEPEPKPKTKKHNKRQKMKRGVAEDGGTITDHEDPNREYISQTGIRVKYIKGEAFFDEGDIIALIADEVKKQLPKDVNPIVQSAKDARAVADEIIRGLGGTMESFAVTTKGWLEEIRQTRFAVVSETSAMSKSLGEIRQFFLGSDYKDQIARLREFVDLCERLQKLKEAGFLDKVADTMLRLA